LPQSPETRRPDRYREAACAARDTVLDRVFAHGVISAADHDAAKREAVPSERRAFPMLAAHASEAALRGLPPVWAGWESRFAISQRFMLGWRAAETCLP
jgi:penicillin-binding protein 1C